MGSISAARLPLPIPAADGMSVKVKMYQGDIGSISVARPPIPIPAAGGMSLQSMPCQRDVSSISAWRLFGAMSIADDISIW